MNTLHACPCCGERTLPDVGEFDICKTCKWEDDPLQREDHDDDMGANMLSLNQYREKWQRNNEPLTPARKPAYAAAAV
ncbi:MAG: hydrolase [Defluviitaleaceae bacterium]|nr:hydrolase [Defluviitaleaceae bacterium]